MKRNKTTNRVHRSGVSPYQRYDKSPHKYVNLDENHAKILREIKGRLRGRK
jgi:hypothetical protein